MKQTKWVTTNRKYFADTRIHEVVYALRWNKGKFIKLQDEGCCKTIFHTWNSHNGTCSACCTQMTPFYSQCCLVYNCSPWNVYQFKTCCHTLFLIVRWDSELLICPRRGVRPRKVTLQRIGGLTLDLYSWELKGNSQTLLEKFAWKRFLSNDMYQHN